MQVEMSKLRCAHSEGQGSTELVEVEDKVESVQYITGLSKGHGTGSAIEKNL